MSTGLLILCSPFNHLHGRMRQLVKTAIKHTGKTLYVQLEPCQTQLWPLSYARSIQDVEFKNACGSFITKFYKTCHNKFQTLDIRFLLANLKHPDINGILLNGSIDVILLDIDVPKSDLENYLVCRFKTPCIGSKIINIPHHFNDEDSTASSNAHFNKQDCSSKCEQMISYDNVVLGGTFDRLHNGHKILLTDAILSCKAQLTIGVTAGPMIMRKKLWELIEPIDVRINNLKNFLNEADGTLQYIIEAITDPFGPSTEDPSLQCIVVSEETLEGGNKVNEERQKKGMAPLHIRVINMVEDDGCNAFEEDKISSSSMRMRSLGERRNLPVIRPYLKNEPYVIGLTGGIASGKSSIAQRLQKLGAGIIDCDNLGHLSYAVGCPAYHRIIRRFGDNILANDGTINRKALGAKVFANKADLDDLTAIVWPEIKRLAQEKLQILTKCGFKIIVMEAAVLLEARWQDLVHEIWVSIIPEEEAVRRCQQRDGTNESQAKQKIEKQMTNVQRIEHANVIFCTAWEPAYTHHQVEKAWKGLSQYLQLQPQTTADLTPSTL